MGTQLSLQGNNTTRGFEQKPGNVVLPTSNGGVIAVVVDSNNSSSPASYGDQTNTAKLEIWYSLNRVTFTQVATITPSVALTSKDYKYAADLYADNSIAIAWGTDTGLKFRKVTFGTWAVSAEQTVLTNPANGFVEALNISVSQSDTVLIASLIYYSAGTSRAGYRLYGQRTGLTTWELLEAERSITTTTVRAQTVAIDVCWANGLMSTGKRAYMVVFGITTTASDMGFYGYVDTAAENSVLVSTSRTTLFTAIGSGDLSFATTYASWPRTCSISATSVDNEFQVATLSIFADARCRVSKYGYDTAWRTRIAPTLLAGAWNSTVGISMPAITQGKDAVNFLINLKSSLPNEIIYSYTATIDPDGNKVHFGGGFRFNNDLTATLPIYDVLGGGGRNASISSTHDIMFVRASTAGGTAGAVLFHHYVKLAAAPIAQAPQGGSTTISSTPPLSVSGHLGIKYPQSDHKGRWEFATDSTFTTNLRVYEQSDSKYITVLNTDVKGTVVRINDILPSVSELTQGNWWVRSALVDQFHQVGNYYTNVYSFLISHKPAAAKLSPSGNQLIMFGTGQITLSWVFTDPSSGDRQTGFQVLIENVDTDSVVYDSGKITSSGTTHVTTLPTAVKDATLRWTVRLWDKDNVVGDYAPYVMFLVADSPTVSISSPTLNQAITSGIPSTTFIPTVGGGRNIRSYRAIWTQSGSTIYDSGDKSIDVPSGTQITFTATKTSFKNNNAYTLKVRVRDELGLEGSSTSRPFSVAFTPPAAPTGLVVSITGFNSETLGGYNSITWLDTARDPDFQYWIISRGDDIIDPNTGNVIEVGEMKEIARVYTPVTTYQYRDYYAPSSYKVNYLVTQVVNRFGDEVESINNTPVSVFPKSDGYWLFEPNAEEGVVSSIRLSIVTADDYTEEWDESEYTIIGRGRHIDRGDRFGIKGTLTAQIRDNEGVSARQKKFRLEQLKRDNTNLYLRNPFGDIWRVYISNIAVSRISGVGTSEYVDVTIPYSEVAD